MVEINTAELQKIELDILNFIDSICKNEGINYSLAYGTLLGAVRHRGFIPWDDDVDVFMTRDEFEKFSSAMIKYGGRYKLCWLSTDKHYSLPLPKVIDTSTILHQFDQDEKRALGVYVDVFIYDTLPSNDEKRERFIRKMNSLQRKWTYSLYKCPKKGGKLRSMVRSIVYFLFHLIGPSYFVKEIDKNAAKYRNEKSDYFGSMTYYGAKTRFIARKHWMKKTIDLEFEKYLFPACEGYEEYLKAKYGDYLELPPIEKRKSQHSFVAYYKTEMLK